MESKIAKKVSRFIELSERFARTEGEVFPEKVENNVIYLDGHTLAVSCSGGTQYLYQSLTIDGREVFIDKDNILKAKDNKPLSRAEKIKAEAEINAAVADAFDEYLTLRSELKQYFTALNKITDEQ